jgi:xylosylprotein 4-beta-galactosyltransferase
MQKEKLLIIVPYRNRKENLSMFIPHMEKWIKEQKIDFSILVSEQSDDGEWFNKGSIINCGFSERKEKSEYVCIHDVDMIPSSKKDCDYSYSKSPIHMASRVQQFGYKLHSKNYWGGVIMCTNQMFETANGFSNLYRGWGKEDIDFGVRLQKCKYKIYRRNGKYESLKHEKHKWHPNKPFDKSMLDKNRKLMSMMRSGEHDFKKDGLNTVKYKIIKSEKISEYSEKITFSLIR